MSSNILICEKCGNTHNGEYSHRFCSASCARAFSSHHVDHKELKPATCSRCGKTIYIKKNASTKTCICSDCRSHKHKERKCIVCGSDTKDGTTFCSERCRVERRRLKTYSKYFGLDLKKIGTPYIFREVETVRDRLYKDYWIENMTSGQICKKYNYPNIGNLVAKVFKYLGIPARDNSQATVLNWMTYSNMQKSLTTPTVYKTEWHTTWDGREVFLRSSYESDYAKELDSKQIEYDVECFRIKYFDTQREEYRCAIPDFYLKEQNMIVEVKSNYTYDEQNMKDKFKAYRELGYKTLLVLEHKEIDI